MRLHTRGNAALVILMLLLAVILAASNVGLLVLSVQHATNSAPTLTAVYASCPPCVIYFVAAPILFGILFVLLLPSRAQPERAAPAARAVRVAEKPAPPSPAPALRLLALLQQEARLVDFLEEDIEAYSDEQVGAAVRSIHAGCRKALNERIELRRIFSQEDGSEVVVEPGFDPAAVRLTGNLSGQPPFHGTLQHGGWRATKVTLPESPGGVDAAIIAPAEVEIE